MVGEKRGSDRAMGRTIVGAYSDAGRVVHTRKLEIIRDEKKEESERGQEQKQR